MNKFTCSILAAALSFSVYSASAATTSSNTDNASSLNNKPIGTTTGVSTNGSTDDTKVGEPINGTTTGTNNDSTSSAPKGY